NQVEIAWENYEPARELGATGPRFMPLLEDDAYVEADTPWRRWLETAAGKKGSDPAWLVQRFADLPLPPNQKAELFNPCTCPCAGVSGTRSSQERETGNLFATFSITTNR